MLRHALIILFVVLGGCAQLPIRIGLFSISGNLVNYSNQSCLLSSIEDTRGFRPLTRPRPVFGVFEEPFRVTPSSTQYKIEVTCNGRIIHQRTVTYPGTLGYGGVVELGVLI